MGQGWHGPRVELLIYVHLLPHCPLKEFGELLKKLARFCAMVIGLVLWPLAHNQILRYGPLARESSQIFTVRLHSLQPPPP
jgi:hypothetical protein